MKKNVQKIVEQIKELLDQLATIAGGQHVDKKLLVKSGSATSKGASGALLLLINEGFFDSPKDFSSIMEKLKEIGRYYPKPTVSMNLLNLTKRRTFSRLKNNDVAGWQYTLRK
ncbi:MAG: hypothetical protein PHX78_09555 [bacterium]|nr:hypothetical protein [bacterium]